MIYSLKEKISKYTPLGLTLFDQGLVSGSGFIGAIIITRALGFANYGFFTLLWFMVLVSFTFYESYFVCSLMTLGAKKVNTLEGHQYFSAQMVIAVLLSTSFALVAFLGIFFAEVLFGMSEFKGLELPVCLTIMAYLLQDMRRRFFFLNLKEKRAITIDLIRHIGQISLLFYLSYIHALTIKSAFWAICFCAFASFFASLYFWDFGFVSINTLRKIHSENWRFSKWLVFSGGLQWLSGNIIVLFSGWFLGAFALGLLRAMQNVLGALTVVLSGLDNFLPQRASRNFYLYGVRGLESYLWRTGIGLMLLTIMILTVILLFPNYILLLIYGAAYQGHNYGYILRLFCIIYFLYVFSRIISYGLRTFEYNQPMTLGYLIALLFDVGAVFFLVKYWGLLGAVIGLLGHNIIIVLVLFLGYFYRRKYRLNV